MREREVMRRAVVLRYGSGGGGGRSGGGDATTTALPSDGGGGGGGKGEPNNEPAAAAPGEARRQPVAGLPRSDGAATPKESSLLWKRLGIALSAGFEEAAREEEEEEEEEEGGEEERGGGAAAAAAAEEATARRQNSSSPSSSLSLIADALAASSTDRLPDEFVSNVLSPRSRPRRRWEPAAYWGSEGSPDPESGEALSFRLAHPLCVSTAVTVRPFSAYFQPGRPVYAPRSVQLASGRSDCWSEGLVEEWERLRRMEDNMGGCDMGGMLSAAGRREEEDDEEDEDEEEEEAPAAAAVRTTISSPPFPPDLERFISTDARGLSEALTQRVVDERRRLHPRGYPRFDGAFLRDGAFGGDSGDGSGRGEGAEHGGGGGAFAFAAASRPLPVRKIGRAQRLSLIRARGEGEEGEGEGEGEEEEGGASPPPSSSRRRQRRQRQSASSPASAAAAGRGGEALMMTGGHAVLLLRGRTQRQLGVDDLYYTCLSYVKVHGFAVRGLRVEFRRRPKAANAAAAEAAGEVERESAAAAAAAAARPLADLVPVLVRIPEGSDPLFDRIPGGLAAVSERGRGASRAARRARALRTAGALFAASPPERLLSPESREGTRRLAEALVAAADDSASDEEEDALFRRDREEEEEEEREAEGGEGEAREGGGGGGNGRGRGRGNELDLDDGEATKATLVAGLLLPDGSSFPVEAAMRMVRMLAAAFARRGRELREEFGGLLR